MPNTKMGRPTDNPKGNSIHIRLDEKCTNVLSEYCLKHKITRAEAIRIAIVKLES